MNSSKSEYHDRSPCKNNNVPQMATKTYWSILKAFVNGTKIPPIPLLLAGNQLFIHF